MEIACIQKLEEKGRHESIVKAAVSDLRALRAGNGGRNWYGDVSTIGKKYQNFGHTFVNQTTLPYQLKVSNNAIPQVLKLEKSQSSLLSLSCILSLTSPCTNLSASTSKAMHTENFPFKIDSFSSVSMIRQTILVDVQKVLPRKTKEFHRSGKNRSHNWIWYGMTWSRKKWWGIAYLWNTWENY